jgi:hypothetical protein
MGRPPPSSRMFDLEIQAPIWVYVAVRELTSTGASKPLGYWDGVNCIPPHFSAQLGFLWRECLRQVVERKAGFELGVVLESQ